MFEKIISLGLEKNLILLSLFVISLLVFKIFRLKRNKEILENKILWLETKQNQKENTELNKLTEEYKSLMRNQTKLETDKEFEKFIDEAEIGDWYSSKK